MSTCVRIRGKKRKLCINDLDRVITLQNRNIIPPLDFGGCEASEEFSDDNDVEAMLVTRASGYTVFDGTNTEVDISHQFYMRYDDSVSTETWILFESKRYDIITMEDLDERHEWLRLNCNVRGTTEKAVNDA